MGGAKCGFSAEWGCGVVPACVFGGIFVGKGPQKTPADWEGLRFSVRNPTEMFLFTVRVTA